MKTLAIIAALTAVIALAEANMMCYYGSWAAYREGEGKFDIEQIDPFLCTTVIYGFAGLGVDNMIMSLDPMYDLCDNGGMCGYDRFTALKQQNPNLKTNLAVGGWTEGSIKYSNMARDPAARATFISSAVQLLKAHNFDGLDMDWEFPTQRGGVPEDKQNFVILLQELRDALHAENMALSVAVSSGKMTVDAAYDVPGIDAAVDMIHLMTYDMHGSWDPYTHHHTILYKYPSDEGDNAFLNVDFAVQYWLSLGASPQKLMMGIAAYGRCWALDSPDSHGMYAPASQPGSPGEFTQEPGYMGYNEICKHGMESPWTEVVEPDMNEPYVYDFNFGNTWCSFDNAASLTIKGHYARDQGLGGLMVWSIDTDDFQGMCNERPFNLIKSAYEAFNGM